MSPLSLDDLKTQAKALRRSLAQDDVLVSHSRSLELVARQLGYRDWNTLHASLGNRPPEPDLSLGARVEGEYLGQPFRGELIAVRAIGSGDHFRIAVRFDEPVDVITFESMSNFRSQVTAVVDRTGVTAQKTSNGKPHLRLTSWRT